jgi:hypothetical protein
MAICRDQREVKPRLPNKVELIFYNKLPFEEILKQVASLPPHSAIFYQQVAVDGAGVVYSLVAYQAPPRGSCYPWAFNRSAISRNDFSPRTFSVDHACIKVMALKARIGNGEDIAQSFVLRPGFETLGWAYSGGQL